MAVTNRVFRTSDRSCVLRSALGTRSAAEDRFGVYGSRVTEKLQRCAEPAAAAFAILHGAGNGILTIAKGTLPLVLFGPYGYGARQGLLMVPARVAQAFAPFLFGLLVDRWGSGALWVSSLIGLAAFGALLWLARLDLHGPIQRGGPEDRIRP